MTIDPAAVMGRYFEAWRAGDPGLLRPVLADDVTFIGPLGSAANANDYVSSIQGLWAITTGLDIRHMFVDGGDVLTWFDLQTDGTPPMPVANWSHVEDGRITRVQVTFDPRPLLPG